MGEKSVSINKGRRPRFPGTVQTTQARDTKREAEV